MSLDLDKRAVYVGFTSGRGILSKAIQLFSGGRANHAFLFYWDERWGCWIEQGAVSGGFLGQWGGDSAPVLPGSTLRLWKAPTDLSTGFRVNAKWLGAPYDLGGLVGMTWVEIMQHAFGSRVGNPLEARNAMFCSEIVSRIIADEGIALPYAKGERFSTTDPVELDEAIRKSGAFDLVYDRPPEPEKAPPAEVIPLPLGQFDSNVTSNSEPGGPRPGDGG